MKSLFFMELKNRTTEIMADKNNETGIGKVLDAVKLITQIFNIVRNEGLLAMEERGEKLGINVTDVFCQIVLCWLLMVQSRNFTGKLDLLNIILQDSLVMMHLSV